MKKLVFGLSIAVILRGSPGLASGGTALDAFNFVTGARAAGMGGAQTASVSDATSLQYNPAALTRVRSFSTELSSLFWVFDIQYHYLAVASPMLGGNYAGSVQYLNYGPIESTEGLMPAVNASDIGFTFGGAYPLNQKWAAGATVKYFGHQYSKTLAMEIAADLGLTFVPAVDQLAFGMVLQNVGYSGKSNGFTPPLPMSLRSGIAYAFKKSDPIYIAALGPDASYNMRFLMAADVSVYQTNEPASFNFGGEVVISERIFFRAGYLSAIRNSGGGMNLGLGVRAFGMRLDYALGMVGELGYGQYVTFTFMPGSDPRPTPLDKEIAESAKKPAIKKKVEKAEVDVEESSYTPGTSMPLKGKFLDEYQKALEDYNDKEYQSAITRLHAILEKNLLNWESWQLLGNCRYAIGSTPGAIKAYRRALKINPNNPQLEAFVKDLEK